MNRSCHVILAPLFAVLALLLALNIRGQSFSHGTLPGQWSASIADGAPPWRTHGWQGRRLDSTGFHHLGERCYDPISGRFLSPDPLGHATSIGLYDYAGGDPINFADPSGRSARNISQSYVTSSSAYTYNPGPFNGQSANTHFNNQFSYQPAATFNDWVNSAVSLTQGFLTVGSYFPVIGTGASLANAVISHSLGDVAGANYHAGVAVENAVFSAVGAGFGSLARIESNIIRNSIPTSSWATPARPIANTLGSSTAAKGADDYVVSFMGSNGRKYYDNTSATLGAPGGSVWVAPLDDITGLSNRAGVVTGTGHAPGPLQSYLKGDSLYGIAVPRSSVSLRLPSAADAGANQHFRLGGVTGVEHNGVWKSSNVREFILNGGDSVPKGSVFFEFGADGYGYQLESFSYGMQYM